MSAPSWHDPWFAPASARLHEQPVTSLSKPRKAVKPAPATRRAGGRHFDVSRLGRDDWLDAAFDAVAEGGFDAVRVLVLADTLGVTRGSFYWHFTDHADLIDALLERWHRLEIDEDTRLQAESTADPQADLLRLLDIALARGGDELKSVRFELALRGLGRRNPAVAKKLVQVDEARMALLESKFIRLTADKRVATERAALFYLAVTGGLQALGRPASAAGTQRVAEFIRGVIAEHVIRR